MHSPWPVFEVSVEGFDPSTVSARSVSAARYQRYLDFSDAFEITFRGWLRISKVRRVDGASAHAEYNYIRRSYGVDLHQGTHVSIRNEGRELEGRTGTVVHPGRPSTSYVHVVLDGDLHRIFVHPFSVVVITDLPAGDEPTGEPNPGMPTVPPVDMSVTARPDTLRSGQPPSMASGA